jgi:hypothetical protein
MPNWLKRMFGYNRLLFTTFHPLNITAGYFIGSNWLQATNRNVAGSIPDGVTGIFH